MQYRKLSEEDAMSQNARQYERELVEYLAIFVSLTMTVHPWSDDMSVPDRVKVSSS